VVAINVEEARRHKVWSQSQTVQQLARFGLKWSRANYAMAIATTAKGTRIREFSADELIAFAQTFQVAVWTLFIPPPDATVALPGGGTTLDYDAMRHYAFAATESPPLRTRREVELQEEVNRNTVDYLLQKLGIDPAALKSAATPSAAQIPEMAEDLAAGIERTIKRHGAKRRK
jgi:hypothetical protein